ncbi:helix-turn-helix transcriptional regulator [Microbispora sp. ATCC PTA-5024]|uniref:helix-turn-helix transcriptional regulator n=1 Tax=Microbispora sp. ATCC PTA-5024 TaxID=316330 RepID=UPI00056BD18B|nr:helix-turn-helix transcriptional regulator [Microbispora sp. ATCC PTA-5024]
MDTDRRLGDFLRARRQAMSPEDVGVAETGRRRTPGLRRVEVARLAGISTDYYIRLEQGRERRPSDHVLSALAQVLGLDEDAARHLHELVHPRPQAGPRPPCRREPVSPALQRLLHGWHEGPAFVHGRWLDVLAVNAVANVLYEGLEHRDNLLRLLFLNPLATEFYADWEETARSQVALLRAAAGAVPDDPFLPQLVEELSVRSAEFRRMWARHEVRPRTTEVRRFRHPRAGEMALRYESLTVNSAPGQQLIVFEAAPGTGSERAVDVLRSLARPAVAARPE